MAMPIGYLGSNMSNLMLFFGSFLTRKCNENWLDNEIWLQCNEGLLLLRYGSFDRPRNEAG